MHVKPEGLQRLAQGVYNESFLFKDIGFKVIKEIAEICHIENYAQNTVLFNKGDDAKSLYILEEGTVNLIIQKGFPMPTKIFCMPEKQRPSIPSIKVEAGLR